MKGWLATAWKAIKGGATLATAGSGFWFYGALVAAGAGLVLWHGWAADGARDDAFAAGQAQVRGEWADANNSAFRERDREIARLLGVTRNWSAINDEYLATIDALERDRDADAGRLQRLAAERRAAVAAATDVAALRSYAATAGDVYEACRGEYRALGLDAERCTAAAHTLKGWADEVTLPAPAQPLGGLGEMFTTTPIHIKPVLEN